MIATAKSAGLPPRRIGRYRLTGRIGRGGMGMVYRCVDEVLEREVAVKTLTAEGVLEVESRRRFEIEAKAAAKLQHPNILTVFELGEDRGLPYIAMELLPGADLEGFLRAQEPLLLQEKLDIVIQVLRGLAFAHEHGIVHRDIKPSNIRILDEGGVKIMDFGIAKLGETNLTKSGMMIGTIHYMSPEQIRGRSLDGRSDIFSVGVILHELLAGCRPFDGEGPTEVLYKIVNAPTPGLPLPDLGELGPRLQEIGNRALEKEPESRYPSASAMAEDLCDVLAGYTRSLETTVASQDLEGLQQARRLIKEGRLEDSQRRLRELVAQSPYSVDARRALRTASREIERRQLPLEADTDIFPELEGTQSSPSTQQAAETLLQPTVLKSSEEARPPGPVTGRGLGLMLAAAAGVVVLAGAYLWHERGQRPPAAASIQVAIRSRPSGAAVWIDARDTGRRTDAAVELPAEGLVLVTLRKEGYRDAARSLSLPLPAGQAVSLDLMPLQAKLPLSSDPAGASVSLDGQRLPGTTPIEISLDPAVEHHLELTLEGHRRQELSVAPGQLTGELRATLEPAGPLGSVTLTSSYPLDVSWRGRALAHGQTSPHFSLPAGRQSLSLSAAAVFMRGVIGVDVRGGAETVAEAPGLGKVNIQANPDNCRVAIDGAFVDYPPILEKPVAAGRHSASFRWADGTLREQSFEVARGGVAFVTGRRD
jgi:serine/threonine protein kinase